MGICMYAFMTLLQFINSIYKSLKKTRRNREMQIEASEKLLKEKPAFTYSKVDLLSIYKYLTIVKG